MPDFLDVRNRRDAGHARLSVGASGDGPALKGRGFCRRSKETSCALECFDLVEEIVEFPAWRDPARWTGEFHRATFPGSDRLFGLRGGINVVPFQGPPGGLHYLGTIGADRDELSTS
jgi:hypothetical protein